MQHKHINVIGAGLAGCEAAYQIAKRGVPVKLYEAKPKQKSAAHSSADFAELVCSNSLKSQDPSTSQGLLKAEMQLFDSLILRCAAAAKIPAGGALAVDRTQFSAAVTKQIKKNPNIQIICQTTANLDKNALTIIATGPLTLGTLADELRDCAEGGLSFYDAAAPIIAAESIDTNAAFFGNRYGKGEVQGAQGDYINCPLTQDEYYAFISALTSAETVLQKDFEKNAFFEGCMPVEVLAARGRDTLRFGPLKPVGLTDPLTNKRPYAVVQLRKENAAGDMYNMVGFQTNLKFNEQKRVFSMIPALHAAEFLRYGVMHRNTFINAPNVLNRRYQVKKIPNLFIAGQLSGVEGYLESAASGLTAGVYALDTLRGGQLPDLPETSLMGALTRYLTAQNPNFQPMNANFGLLPPLNIRCKQTRKQAYTARSLADLQEFINLQLTTDN
ncbi:MAG: methylenetetrahydrofolate--tRNA-(uracil(54)-C(5))-methyltransferase (FADH(2)-oxidizing) TrmFO [Firmicutes bacterium]|nr:methylenetetrahydrofolate--tRNA-(uracil(54)-C(5))-methyltransferase (FADH(2)-oxidizing) TrmFO [Bacillota bacterium]